MSRQVNRGAPQRSPGGPWQEEGARGSERPPRDTSRRTVLVMGHPAQRPERPSGPTPTLSRPVLTPRQGPPLQGSVCQQQTDSADSGGASSGPPPGGPSGERKKLPFMALNEIIRQQHSKVKGFVAQPLSMARPPRRGRLCGGACWGLVGALEGYLAGGPLLEFVCFREGPNAAVCALTLLGAPRAAVFVVCTSGKRPVCSSTSSTSSKRGPAAAAAAAAAEGSSRGGRLLLAARPTASLSRPVQQQQQQPQQDRSPSPHSQQQQQQGSARNALFGADGGLQRRGAPFLGPPPTETRRVRVVSGAPSAARDEGRHGHPRGGPPEGPPHQCRSPRLRERPSVSPEYSRGPYEERDRQEGPHGRRPYERGPDGYGSGGPRRSGRGGPRADDYRSGRGAPADSPWSDEERAPRGPPRRGSSPPDDYEEAYRANNSGWAAEGPPRRESRGPRKRGFSPPEEEYMRGPGGPYEGHRQHRRAYSPFRGAPRGPRGPNDSSYGSPPPRGPADHHSGSRRLHRGPYEGHSSRQRRRSDSRESHSEGPPIRKRSPVRNLSPGSSSGQHRRSDWVREGGGPSYEGAPYRGAPMKRRRTPTSRSRSRGYIDYHQQQEGGAPKGGPLRGPSRSLSDRDRAEGRRDRRVYCSRSSSSRRHRRGGRSIDSRSSRGSRGSKGSSRWQQQQCSSFKDHKWGGPHRGPLPPSRQRSVSSSSRHSSSRADSHRDRGPSRSAEGAPRRGPSSRSSGSYSRGAPGDYGSEASASIGRRGPSRPRQREASSPARGPPSLEDDRERWRHRKEELQRRLRGGSPYGKPPAAAAAAAGQSAAGKQADMGAPGGDWRHQQPLTAAYTGSPQGDPLGSPHPVMLVHNVPHLRAPAGFYSAQGSSSSRDKGPPTGAPSKGGPFSPQDASRYSSQAYYSAQGPPAAAWQQQQQQQYSSSMWGPAHDDQFMSAARDVAGAYGPLRGPPDGCRHPHQQQDLQQQQQHQPHLQQQRALELAGGSGAVPPPPKGALHGGSATGAPSSMQQALPSQGGPPGEEAPTRACRDFVLGGRCPRGPSCGDLHPPPQEYHKFHPHSLLLLPAYGAEALELQRRFAANVGVRQQQQQQPYEQQQQQQQQAPRGLPRQQQQQLHPGGSGVPASARPGGPLPPHPMGLGGPHHHYGGPPPLGGPGGPPRPSGGPPMGPAYQSPAMGGAIPGMQGYPQMYGSPSMGPGGPRGGPLPFRGLEGPYAPPGGPPRGRLPMGPGGPLGAPPEAPPPFIMRTPRPMQGPLGEGVPRPPPPEPPRGAGGAPWFGPGRAPPPPFPHQLVGGGLPPQGGPLKKRKGSAGKSKAKKQRNQQQLLQQQRAPAHPQSHVSTPSVQEGAPGGPSPLVIHEETHEAAAEDLQQQPDEQQQQQQEQQEGEEPANSEERQQEPECQQQEQLQEDEGGEEAEGPAGSYERTEEQQALLSDYLASKSPDFLASDAYLEGWNKKDLIEYFYDQYLQQDMTAADALASATSYVENPEAYGLVGGAPAEEETAAAETAAAVAAAAADKPEEPDAAAASEVAAANPE
ncbi:hypothetical protein Efla_001300 [Eimeria flavescens]